MSDADAQVWHLSTHEGQAGPYTQTELRAFLSEGRISPEYYVWREGFAEWRQIKDTDVVSVSAPAPSVPPESQPSILSLKMCSTCGLENDESAENCTRCGSKLAGRRSAGKSHSGIDESISFGRKKSADPLPTPTQVTRRPGIITALSILLIGSGFVVGVGVFTDAGSQEILKSAGEGFLWWLKVYALFMLICGVGLWCMKQWAGISYILFRVADWIVCFVGGVNIGALSTILGLVVIWAVVKHLPDMD
ncbi:DUF4339 domain-containing protein [bacterium]|nr:DUF4339 domain-containing protein [bacterium]